MLLAQAVSAELAAGADSNNLVLLLLALLLLLPLAVRLT
jgi:hypothetical protein